MKLFDKKLNYSEYTVTRKEKSDLSGLKDPTKLLSELPDGQYKGLRYGYTVELEDGSKYRDTVGVRQSRSVAVRSGFQDLVVKDGKLQTLATTRFSGMAEIGGALMGASYGKSDDRNKVAIDTDGFGIPSQIKSVFKLKDNKSFSMNRSGAFVGGVNAPTIGISKDNTIIRSNKTNTGKSGVSRFDAPAQDNKMTNVTLDWNKDRAFHLAVEPWITTPLISDTEDGIYIGSIKGDKVDTGKNIITLTIKIQIDYPESVIVLVKNQKAFIFKQSQLTASTGSRIFSRNSEVTSDEEFRSYAHNLMKSAHKDNYDPDKTDKVVNDLLKNHEGKDYGELIGRLRSGLGNKSYSDNDTKDINYAFDYTVVEPKMEMQAVIGTLVMSVAFGHLFHLCTTDYPVHIAMEDYYKKMPELVDELAENYLATTKSANFQICIVPKTIDPIEYFQRLQEFIIKYQSLRLSNEPQFSSLMDNISNLIGSTLYRLKRLQSGKRLFSFNSTYSKKSDEEVAIELLKPLKDLVKDLIIKAKSRYRRSPIKGVESEKQIDDFIDKNLHSESDFKEIIGAVIDGISNGPSIYKRVYKRKSGTNSNVK